LRSATEGSSNQQQQPVHSQRCAVAGATVYPTCTLRVLLVLLLNGTGLTTTLQEPHCTSEQQCVACYCRLQHNWAPVHLCAPLCDLCVKQEHLLWLSEAAMVLHRLRRVWLGAGECDEARANWWADTATSAISVDTNNPMRRLTRGMTLAH
jgi:hypothetical protein